MNLTPGTPILCGFPGRQKDPGVVLAVLMPQNADPTVVVVFDGDERRNIPPFYALASWCEVRSKETT